MGKEMDRPCVTEGLHRGLQALSIWDTCARDGDFSHESTKTYKQRVPQSCWLWFQGYSPIP